MPTAALRGFPSLNTLLYGIEHSRHGKESAEEVGFEA